MISGYREKVLEAYEVCGSIREAARLAGCNYKTALHHIEKAGVKIPGKAPAAVILYKGRTPSTNCIFRLQPNGWWRSDDRSKGRPYLHRYVWEHEVGPIPEGHHIHHKDGDKSNNKRENLECLSEAEHQAFHRKHGYGHDLKGGTDEAQEEREVLDAQRDTDDIDQQPN